MEESYVYRVRAQVKANPHSLEEMDTLLLADTLQQAMGYFESEIYPKTVYHYHSIVDQGCCLHG